MTSIDIKFVQEKALRDATDAGARDLVEALSQLDEMVGHCIYEIKYIPVMLHASFSLLAGQTQVSRNGSCAITCKFTT